MKEKSQSLTYFYCLPFPDVTKNKKVTSYFDFPIVMEMKLKNCLPLLV